MENAMMMMMMMMMMKSRLRAGWRSSSVRSIITCGGGARGARRSGRHVVRRQGREGGGVFQKRSYCPGCWDKLQTIKFDERGTSGGRAVEKERMGIGWKDALEGNKFEFAKGI